MTFHLALAGLALLLPFATAVVLDIPCDGSSTTFASQGGCNFINYNEGFNLGAGNTYTFEIHRSTCEFDIEIVINPLNTNGYPVPGPNDGLALSSTSSSPQGSCDSVNSIGSSFKDPVIVYQATSEAEIRPIYLFVIPWNAPVEACPAGSTFFYNVTYSCALPGGGSTQPGGGSAQGDPHFKTWRGQPFNFHGECDLVLLHNAEFESGLALDVHIRTKIRRDMSYISSAALRIGQDLLEVESQGVYWWNGELSAALPAEFSGFAFSHTQPTDKQHVFEVHFGGRERIKLKTYKDFVSVLVEQGQNKHFGDSAGLMGDFRTGHMIARDGKTVIDDANVFGQEWQVLETESSLFTNVRLPQHPNVCTMPTPVQASRLRRRLAATSSVDELAAEKACEHWGEGKDDCVFDVLTTGDLEMAMVGAY
jgi:hypothetical protein